VLERILGDHRAGQAQAGGALQLLDPVLDKVGYGSCSGCDTLQATKDYSDEKPTPDQVSQYMILALHIVQGFKQLGGEVVCD
jgi:hypothetical protein